MNRHLICGWYKAIHQYAPLRLFHSLRYLGRLSEIIPAADRHSGDGASEGFVIELSVENSIGWPM